MKKILIITNKLVVGGIEKALWEMLHVAENDDISITVAVMNSGGEMYQDFCQHYKVSQLPQVNEPVRQLIIKKIKKRNFIKVFSIISNVIKCNLVSDYNAKCYYRSKIYDSLAEKYDIAICYHKPTDLPVTYTLNCVNATEKWLWLHSEVESITTKEQIWYRKIYDRFDKVICASYTIQKQFIKKFPEYENKTVVFRNIVNIESIIRKAESGKGFEEFSGTKILTVARLSKEKGIDLAIKAARLLKEKEKKFVWYIVGDGDYLDTLKNLTKDLGVEDVVKFLGVQKNPYGFFKSCDIYVQPSYEEGYGITIAEAKLFQKTIILTPFGSAEEHITSDYNGIIAKDFTGEALFDELWNVLENPNVRNKFQKNLKNEKEMKNASFKELVYQKCKIAIVSQIQTNGGTEHALIEMLNILAKKQYDVTLFLLEWNEFIISMISPKIKVIKVEQMKDSAKDILKSSKSIKDYLIKLYHLIASRNSNFYSQYYHVTKYMSRRKEKFDVGISYFSPASLSDYYNINCIRSNKKYAWIHADVQLFPGIEQGKTKWLYNCEDRIFCVSKDAKASFDKLFVECNNKSLVQYNALPVDKIKEKAMETSLEIDQIRRHAKEKIFVTVSRISEEKGQMDAIDAAVKLKELGVSFVWYFIGDGELLESFREKIRHENMREQMIAIGARTNPYPFIKACDIYIQTSRREGFCLAIAEAVILHKPVVSNCFNAAKEQIITGENGFVVDLNTDEFCNVIQKLVSNIDFYKEILKNAETMKSVAENEMDVLTNSILIDTGYEE